MKKNTMTLVMVMLMLLTVCLYFIAGTYARYTDSREGNAQVSIAKWAVKITDGETNPVSNNFTLPFEVVENEHVVDGKFAPNSTAKATIELDLTGTEVAVDFGVVVNEAALKAAFGASGDNVTVTTTVEGAATSTDLNTINLPNGEAFDASNGKVTIDITLAWENEEVANVADTALGATAGTLNLPVELTLKQHI